MLKDVIAGGVLVVLAIAYWLAAGTIPRSVLGGSVGAAGLPKLLAVALGVLAVLLMVQSVWARRPAQHPAAAAMAAGETSTTPRQHRRALGMLTIGVAYVLAVDEVGYLVGIAVLLAAVPLYMGKRPSLAVGAFAVFGAVLLDLVFVRMLSVPMPAGFWPRLLG